ncbi:hypothetical protein VNO78_01315 [Psophocarpus tetragonolobus]|uniref:Uncharacterized protein n=1 Tax=Psophocarpus tetragonolobus TaxID=3891 RepID=A0AAN9TAB2_PSOTE
MVMEVSSIGRMRNLVEDVRFSYLACVDGSWATSCATCVQGFVTLFCQPPPELHCVTSSSLSFVAYRLSSIVHRLAWLRCALLDFVALLDSVTYVPLDSPSFMALFRCKDLDSRREATVGVDYGVLCPLPKCIMGLEGWGDLQEVSKGDYLKIEENKLTILLKMFSSSRFIALEHWSMSLRVYIVTRL